MLYEESDKVELKSIVTDEIKKEIISFANTSGGIIYIGISDDGKVIGVDNYDKTIIQIVSMIKDNIEPDLTMFLKFEKILDDDKTIVKIIVGEGSNKPYYLQQKGLKPSGVYVRSGNCSIQSSNEAIKKMILSASSENFEDLLSLKTELTFNTLNETFKKKNLPFDKSKMKSLGIVDKSENFTNLGLILSDQCPMTSKLALFQGTDEMIFLDRVEFSGSILTQIDDIENYFTRINKVKSNFSGFDRIDNYDYPFSALKEAILNSFVHRDYSTSISTIIGIYDDRVEIKNYGNIYGGLQLEDVLKGISSTRNPKLASIFYRLGLIEAYGTGLRRINQCYSKFKSKPKFESTTSLFICTLPNTNYELDKENDISLPKDKKLIIEYLKENKQITTKDVTMLLNISNVTACKLFKELITSNLIKSNGKGKSTFYTLNDE